MKRIDTYATELFDMTERDRCHKFPFLEVEIAWKMFGSILERSNEASERLYTNPAGSCGAGEKSVIFEICRQSWRDEP